LQAPIVSDCAGVLYNKDTIIEHILPKQDAADDRSEHDQILQGRVKSLRDVVEVKFQTEKGDAVDEERRICPVTSKELGPSTKAVYLVPCGHAFSETAVKEVASDTCLACNEKYTPDNVIPILPLAKEDTERLAERMLKLGEAGLTHSLKKAPGSKKRKKHDKPESQTVANGHNGDHVAEKRKSSQISGLGPKSLTGDVTPAARIKNAATASLTQRVLDEQAEKNKKRKLEMNDNIKSLFSAKGPEGPRKNNDFMTRGFSVQHKSS
jgi:hypothetical protein